MRPLAFGTYLGGHKAMMMTTVSSGAHDLVAAAKPVYVPFVLSLFSVFRYL